MFTLFYDMILFVLAIVCFILAILFVISAFKNRANKKIIILSTSLSILFIFFTFSLLNIDLYNYEIENRDDSIGAFEGNFGFKPPSSIKEIKLKNYGWDNISKYWMAFSYDSNVLNKVLKHDQPLSSARFNSEKFNELCRILNSNNSGCPDWFKLPGIHTPYIYYKENFIKDSSKSKYYLWIDEQEKMIYLNVEYWIY